MKAMVSRRRSASGLRSMRSTAAAARSSRAPTPRPSGTGRCGSLSGGGLPKLLLLASNKLRIGTGSLLPRPLLPGMLALLLLLLVRSLLELALLPLLLGSASLPPAAAAGDGAWRRLPPEPARHNAPAGSCCRAAASLWRMGRGRAVKQACPARPAVVGSMQTRIVPDCGGGKSLVAIVGCNRAPTCVEGRQKRQSQNLLQKWATAGPPPAHERNWCARTWARADRLVFVALDFCQRTSLLAVFSKPLVFSGHQTPASRR